MASFDHSLSSVGGILDITRIQTQPESGSIQAQLESGSNSPLTTPLNGKMALKLDQGDFNQACKKHGLMAGSREVEQKTPTEGSKLLKYALIALAVIGAIAFAAGAVALFGIPLIAPIAASAIAAIGITEVIATVGGAILGIISIIGSMKYSQFCEKRAESEKNQEVLKSAKNIYSELNDEFVKLQQEQETLKSQMTKLEQDHANVISVQQLTNSELDRKQNQFEKAEKASVNLHTKNEELADELDLMKKQLAATQQLAKPLEARVTQLMGDNTKQKNKIEELQTRSAGSMIMSKHHKSQARKAVVRESNVKSEVRDHLTTTIQQKETIAQLTSRILKAEAHIQQLNQKNAKLEQERDTAEEQLHAELSSGSDVLSGADGELQSTKAELKAATDKLNNTPELIKIVQRSGFLVTPKG
jgi:hypothetical protein